MRRTLFVAAALLPMLLACKEQPKQEATKAPAAPEPIPSDIVYNSFFASPSGAADLKVAFDGGAGDGGSAGAGAADGGEPREGPEAAPGKIQVTEPGAEPRAKLQYAFALGRAATVTSTITLSVSAPGQPGAGDQPPITFTYVITPKARTPEGKTHFDIKISKVDVALPPTVPQAAQQKAMLEKSMVGVEAGFDASSSGEVGEVKLASDKVPRMAQQILPLVVQSFEFLIAPLPGSPVGIGAKWASASGDPQTGVKLVTSYTLLAQTATTAQVRAETSLSSPRRAVDDEQLPPGAMLEEKGTGSYVVDLRLDGVASRAEGSMSNSKTITVPKQGSQSMVIKQSQKLESR